MFCKYGKKEEQDEKENGGCFAWKVRKRKREEYGTVQGLVACVGIAVAEGDLQRDQLHPDIVTILAGLPLL